MMRELDHAMMGQKRTTRTWLEHTRSLLIRDQRTIAMLVTMQRQSNNWVIHS